MQYLSSADRVQYFWDMFGQSLAAMHMADTSVFVSGRRYGFDTDNYIGATVQINSPRDSWIDFFRDNRLRLQFKMAEIYFDTSDIKKIYKLLDKLPELLIEPDHPSLLHGDLWSGNYIVGNDGKAWLIDPSVYVGHSEAERDLYNLYHLINHLNLFGGTYYSAVISTIDYYVR